MVRRRSDSPFPCLFPRNLPIVKQGPDTSEKLKPFFNDVDLLIIEGFVDGPGKKIEVWREKVGTVPRILEREDIDVVITDDNIDTQIPVWPRNDIAKIADNICTLAELKR